MVNVVIASGDGRVGVDGEFRTIDLSDLDPLIVAVHWDGTVGEIEYAPGKRAALKTGNIPITDFTPFQKYVTRWTNAAPPPPTLGELKTAKIGEFVTEGVKRVAAQVPDWDSIETIKTVSGLWVSHLATNATPAQLKAKDIYLYVRDTVPLKIAAVDAEADLALVDPTVADPFGDGTLWPA